MKVLTITNMWPIKESQYYGIFVKEQVEALKKYHPEINNKIYFINGKKSSLNYFWSIFSINWLIMFNKFDVIHIHYALSGIFLLFNPFIKSPVIMTFHGSDFNSHQKFYKMIISIIIKKLNGIVYLNTKMGNNLISYKKILHHIPCGVDTQLFIPNKVNRNDKKFKIAFPASASRPEKNYEFFNRVIQYLISEYKYEIEVFVVHNKTRSEVRDVLNEIDLLCMTSLTEGSPQIIKEAMCCNTPVVSSDVGDVKDLLSDIKNTYIVEKYIVKDFAEAINKILVSPLQERITNGREKIFNLGLDDKSTSKKILEIYKYHAI